MFYTVWVNMLPRYNLMSNGPDQHCSPETQEVHLRYISMNYIYDVNIIELVNTVS